MKFPKLLYVTIENDDEEWLNPAVDIAAHAKVNKSVKVARYQLVEVGTVEAKVVYFR